MLTCPRVSRVNASFCSFHFERGRAVLAVSADTSRVPYPFDSSNYDREANDDRFHYPPIRKIFCRLRNSLLWCGRVPAETRIGWSRCGRFNSSRSRKCEFQGQQRKPCEQLALETLARGPRKDREQRWTYRIPFQLLVKYSKMVLGVARKQLIAVWLFRGLSNPSACIHTRRCDFVPVDMTSNFYQSLSPLLSLDQAVATPRKRTRNCFVALRSAFFHKTGLIAKEENVDA